MRPLAHPILPRLVSLLTLITFLQIKLCSSVDVQGFEVKDLAGSGSCFQLESTSWSASSLVTPSKMTSTCVYDILGGPNILATSSDMSFQRVYQYLPFHNKIYFALTLYAIDSWASAQLNKPLIEITFDSTTMGNITAQQVSTPSLCGSTTVSDQSVRIFGKIDHSANTLFFKIGSNNSLSSSVGSFGIRSVSLILSSDSITADNRICAIGTGIVTGNCSCLEGQYLDSTGTCQPCSTNCSSCFGPTGGQCYECKSGYGYDGYECVKCDSSCGSCLSTASNGCTGCKDMFALYNGVCRSSCPAPLNQTMDACEVSFCQSACAPPNILFPDNYCGSACAAPLLTMLVSGSLQCKSPCAAGVPFLYWNGTCQGICESPLQNKTAHGISYCEYTCPDNEYLYTNGSCLSNCSLPLKEEIQGGKLFCLYPCSSNQYVLPNGSCTEACLPIDRYTEAGNNYCHYPSLAPPVVCKPPNYMYWNSSCLSTCNFPLQVETDAEGIDYCEYPCSSTQYLYWNGSCLNQCESPLHQRIESGYLFCDAACGQRQYITLNGTCLDSCEAPLRVKVSGNSKLCLLPCDDPTMYYHEGNQQCSADCDSPEATSLNGYLYCPDDEDNSGDDDDDDTDVFGSTIEAGAATFITLTKYMEYVRYLNVKMPNRLEILAASSGRPILSLEPSQGLAYRIQGWFSNRRLAVIVSKQVLPERFLANFGGELIILVIVCAIAFIFTGLKVMSKKKKWQIAALVFEKLQILTRWNFLVMLFSMQIDEIILFSALEFSTLDFDGAAAVFSFLFCLATIGVTFAFLIGLFKVTRKSFAIQERLSSQKNEEMSPSGVIIGNLNEGLQVIYSGFNTSRSFNKFFYLFYVCRSALPMLLAIIFSTVPVVQAAFQIIISLIIVAYISYMRPLKNKINHYQLIIIETIVLIMNMSVLILTILGKQDMSNKSSDIFFGDVVIIGNITINALIIAVLILKVGYMIKDIKTLYHKDPFQAKLSCIHLLTLPLQQGAFGFEQLLPDINPVSASPVLTNNQKQVIITEAVQVPDGKLSPKKNISPKKIPQEDTISPGLVTQKSITAHRNTSLGVEEEQSELPTTERFGQSSARLLLTSQVLNQSQVIPQINNLVSMNDSILDLSTSSPRNKRALSSFLKNMNVPTVINLRGSTIQTRQTRANSHYEDYEKDPRPVDLSRSSMIVRTRQIRNPITRAQTNMDISGNEGGNNNNNHNNSSLPPIPNRGLIVRNNSTANLRQEL